MLVVALSVDKVELDHTPWLRSGWSVCTWPEDYCHIETMSDDIMILKAMGEAKKMLMVSTQPKLVEILRTEGMSPLVVHLSRLPPPVEVYPNEQKAD